jgi:hypothetical protein
MWTGLGIWQNPSRWNRRAMDLPNALAEADRFPGSPDNSMDYPAVERYLARDGSS